MRDISGAEKGFIIACLIVCMASVAIGVWIAYSCLEIRGLA